MNSTSRVRYLIATLSECSAYAPMRSQTWIIYSNDGDGVVYVHDHDVDGGGGDDDD